MVEAGIRFVEPSASAVGIVVVPETVLSAGAVVVAAGMLGTVVGAIGVVIGEIDQTGAVEQLPDHVLPTVGVKDVPGEDHEIALERVVGSLVTDPEGW